MNKGRESQQSYFKQLLKSIQRREDEYGQKNQIYQQTQIITKNSIQEAMDEIIIGMIQFKQKPDKIQQIIKMPLHKKIGNDISQLDQKIKQNQELLKQAKRQLLLHKKQQQQAIKIQHQIKSRQNQQKIKLWAEQQKILNDKRKMFFEKRQKLIQQQQEKLKQLKQMQKQQQIEQRRRSLQNRLKKMQQSRQKRKQIYQQGINQYKSIKQPKYKQIQKQFEKVIAQQNFQKQIIKKNIKIAKQLNFDKIKQHDKNYMQKLYQRYNQKGYKSHRLLNEQQKLMYQSRFKNLLKRTDQQIQLEKQKFQRRLNFQSRLSQIHINIDDAKKIKIQIERDKAKNPLKYNFLRQKQLNDYQIYMEFKDFQIDIDRNELGKNYLQQSRKIGQESRIKKSHSVSAISLKNKQKQTNKQRYIDYLPEIRAHRSAYNIQKYPTSKKIIQQVMRRQENKQKAIEKISISLKKYDDKIKDKKVQLRTLNSISSTIRKEKQIDQMYMKSLKAKLACLQIKQQF